MKRYAAAWLMPLLIAAYCPADPYVDILGIYYGQEIGGIYYGIEAVVESPTPVDRVEFYLDGWLFRVETIPPYYFNGDHQGVPYGWDTTIYPNGTYTMTAIAFDDEQLSGLAEISFDIFNNRPPTASCQADPAWGDLPLAVQFTGIAEDPDNQALDYSWNFGDGGQSPLQHPQHTYSGEARVYIAWFTVVDPKGASARSRICVRAGMLPYLEENGLVAMEAENYDYWREDGFGAEWIKRKDKPGYSGDDGFIQHAPNSGISYGFGTPNPSVEYWVDFLKTGRYYVWLRGFASAGNAACSVSFNGTPLEGTLRWTVYNSWHWVGAGAAGTPITIDLTEPCVGILAIHGGEDGLAVDKIMLTSDPFYTPSGTGPAASQRAERPPPLPGDVNHDGVVSILDLIYVRNALGKSVSEAPDADANGDGKINVLDLIFVRNHLGTH